MLYASKERFVFPVCLIYSDGHETRLCIVTGRVYGACGCICKLLHRNRVEELRKT